MEKDRGHWHYLGVLCVLIGCALLLTARLIYAYLGDSLRFPINTVKITAAYHHITHKQLENILERYTDASFFTFPIVRLEKSLNQLNWIKRAAVERQWPDILKITLLEKEPFAFWNDKILTTDREIIAKEGFVAESFLPTLKGLDGQQKQILQVYQKLSKILTTYNLQAAVLELRPNNSWELTLANGILLRLGKQDLELRVNRFCKAYPAVFGEYIGNKQALIRVDLRYPRGMAVQEKRREDNG